MMYSSSEHDENSRQRHAPDGPQTGIGAPSTRPTPASSSPKPVKLHRRQLNLLRYCIFVIGAGAAGTFFLQALNVSSYQGAHLLSTDHDPVKSLFFGGKDIQRQLASSDNKLPQEFANIADQVRKQIEADGLLDVVKSKDNAISSSNSTLNVWLLEDEEEEDEFEIPVEPERPPPSSKDNKTAASGQKTQPPPKEEPPLPDFSHAPPPRNLTEDDKFAACLLIKDDNHWLIEWLAYHYHVLPLRRLIVAVDPDSKTTPTHILARWSFQMKIDVWKDDDFLRNNPVPPRMLRAYRDNPQLMNHRHRQNTFYIKCLQQVKQEGYPWVHLTDTDEFIAINYASGPLYNLTKHHPIQQPGSVLRFLNHHQDATQDVPKCIFMPRYMFGNKESKGPLVERNVPKKSTITGRSMLTQRFMYRHPKKMQNGKNLMHLSAIDQLQPMANVHRVSSSCPTHDSVKDVNHIKSTLVKVHHYLGTQEQYFYRSDPRGSDQNATVITSGLGNYHQRDNERYDQLNARAIYSDSGARGWIKGFVDQVGVPLAEYLLKGIGEVGVE